MNYFFYGPIHRKMFIGVAIVVIIVLGLFLFMVLPSASAQTTPHFSLHVCRYIDPEWPGVGGPLWKAIFSYTAARSFHTEDSNMNPDWSFTRQGPLTKWFDVGTHRAFYQAAQYGDHSYDYDLVSAWTWTVTHLGITRTATFDRNTPFCPGFSPPSPPALSLQSILPNVTPEYFALNAVTVWSVNEHEPYSWKVADEFGTWHPVVEPITQQILYTPAEYRMRYNDVTGQEEHTRFTRLNLELNQPVNPTMYKVFDSNGDETGVWIEFGDENCAENKACGLTHHIE